MGKVTINAHNRQVAQLFNEMMELLRVINTFGYYPVDLPADGKLREIKLTLSAGVRKEKGEVKTLARDEYHARKPSSQLRPVRATAQPGAVIQSAESNSKDASSTDTPADVAGSIIFEEELNSPDLNAIKGTALFPSCSCRPKEEMRNGYQCSALFLSGLTRRRNSLDLLFNGACDNPDYFEAAIVGDDKSLIAELGPDRSLDEVSAPHRLNLRSDHVSSEKYNFAREVKVEIYHTYGVLIDMRDGLRGLFVFTAVGYIPNGRVDLIYIIKEYQFPDLNRTKP